MCNLGMTQEQAVRDVVDEMTQNGKTFSSYDVTKLVRNISGIGNVRHRNGVREFVHELFNDQSSEFPSDYSRTNIQRSFGLVMIFHPISVDPETYDENNVNAPVADVDTDEDEDDDDDDDVVDGFDSNVDKRGRLCICKKLMEEMGVGTHDSVVVYVTDVNAGDSRVLCVNRPLAFHPPKATPPSTTLVVDARDNNIRIGKRTLKTLSDAKAFKVEVVGNDDKYIVISAP